MFIFAHCCEVLAQVGWALLLRPVVVQYIMVCVCGGETTHLLCGKEKETRASQDLPCQGTTVTTSTRSPLKVPLPLNSKADWGPWL